MTILLADDEADILEFLGYNLEREGFRVIKARNGHEAVSRAQESKPQLIILDVMMPGMDGIEACRRIRKLPGLSDSLVVFLTARGEDYSQIAGFEAGADDYITKPIKPRLFVHRIQALMRRYKGSAASSGIVQTGDMIIDRDRYLVTIGGQEYTLARKEFELLLFLASRPDKVITREEIFVQVWGTDVVVGDRTIDVHIRRIREKLNTDRIRTVKGVGYKFEEG